MSNLAERHKQELKELRAKTQSIKKAASGGNKQAKKQAQTEIAQLEQELAERHQKELASSQPETDIPTQSDASQPAPDEAAEEVDSAPKISRAAARKLRKNQEMERMKEEARLEAMSMPDHAAEEQAQILKLAADLGFKVYEIAANGHCLYSAIAHQFSLVGQKKSFIDVRKDASAELKSNREQYMPFLLNDDGNILSEGEYDEYCSKVATSAEWGGHIELQALSNTYKVPIFVLQAHGNAIEIGEDGNTPLRLSYHRHAYRLGEHYNSLVPENRP